MNDGFGTHSSFFFICYIYCKVNNNIILHQANMRGKEEHTGHCKYKQ